MLKEADAHMICDISWKGHFSSSLFFFGLFFKLRDFQIAAVSESDDSDDGPNYEPLHH